MFMCKIVRYEEALTEIYWIYNCKYIILDDSSFLLIH